MQGRISSPRSGRVRGPASFRHVAIPSTIGAMALAGCQTYEPRPLDIAAHRERLEARLTDTEPVERFLARLVEGAPGSETMPPERFSLDDGLSPSEGEALALFYNPDLRLARAEAGVALATFETAGLWEDPVFGFDGADILSSAAPFEYGLTLSFTIPISGRLDVARDRAGAAYEASLREIVDREWSTRMDVRRAWARWTAARLRVGVMEELISGLEDVASLMETLREAGELSRADARVFTITLASQRASLIEARAGEALERTDLLFLMGLPGEAAIDLEPGFVAMPALGPELDLDASLIAGNTTLGVRRAEYRVAEETLRLEIRKQIPDIEFGSGYGSEDDDRLLLGVSVPIPILNANRQAIAEARAQRELSRARAETTYERLSRDLRRALIERRQTRARREAVEREVLLIATEQRDELRRVAELGEVNTFLTFESVSSIFDVRTRVIDLELGERLAEIRVFELLGPPEPALPAPVGATPNEAPASAEDTD